MGVGIPLPDWVQNEIRELVERAAGPEMVQAIRDRDREVREMWAHMTDEERVTWILGEPVP